MLTFEELYTELAKRTFHQNEKPLPDYNPYHLDCLLNPKQHPPVIHKEDCSNCGKDASCIRSCIFDAITEDKDGKMRIDATKCVGCEACIEACANKNITNNRDVLPALKAVRESKGRAYALVAPALSGQFSENVSLGRIRSALKELGFGGMIEVALFADILTLKEALEFDKNINDDADYQLTSCCCPMWIAMIRKVYHELMPHVPGAVSPMVACGRTIKKLHPDAITIFIGPCIAKKAEAREPDIADAVDYVLTFQELQDIFDIAGIEPQKMPDNEKDNSSRCGRIYARSGGVSEAVRKTVEQLDPDKKIKIRTRQAEGIPACKAMIEELKQGRADVNFFEGMGCVGGCVGGPKTLINKTKGKDFVDEYGDLSASATPLENPYVMELLERLGFHTVEQLLEESTIFTRTFHNQ